MTPEETAPEAGTAQPAAEVEPEEAPAAAAVPEEPPVEAEAPVAEPEPAAVEPEKPVVPTAPKAPHQMPEWFHDFWDEAVAWIKHETGAGKADVKELETAAQGAAAEAEAEVKTVAGEAGAVADEVAKA